MALSALASPPSHGIDPGRRARTAPTMPPVLLVEPAKDEPTHSAQLHFTALFLLAGWEERRRDCSFGSRQGDHACGS